MTNHTGQYFGRYYLIGRLGEGGMAVVYKAHDTRLDRDVAIKVIRTGAFPADDLGAMLKRFEREAQSLAKLSHPNIVKVYDFGEHEGSPYLVMEYVPGGTLKALIGKPVPWRNSIRLIIPVARGVAYAHKRGVLHRDIKPANVLISDEGEPLLSDFGIARLFEGEPTTELTRAGAAIGTPGYMAPEQWEGTTSPQSDLYSLGVILYEMVTGRKPFIADTPPRIMIKQATEPVPSPSKFVSGLPDDLEHVLFKVLAKEPSNRYQDLNAFIDALEKLLVNVPDVPLSTDEQVPVDKTSVPETVVASPRELSALPVAESMPFAEVAAMGEEDKRAEDLVRTYLSSTPASSSIPGAEGERKEKQKFANPVSSPRTPIKISRKWAWILGGASAVILVILLGSPYIEKLLPQAPLPTPTKTIRVQPSLTEPFAPMLLVTDTFSPTETLTPAATALPNEITDPKGVKMVLVAEGEFTMGFENENADEQPPHKVFLDPYYIDKYEVTNAQYKACVDTSMCDLPAKTEKYDDPQYEKHPVIWVNWNMAEAYCESRGARLPTEAEWEKAARGTDGRPKPWGYFGIDCTYANYNDGNKYCVGDTTIVGSYEKGRSPYGAYDMVGNVWEWVADWYGENYYASSPEQNPAGPESGNSRVLRGAAWSGSGNYAVFVNSVYRNRANPTDSGNNIGFRCARLP